MQIAILHLSDIHISSIEDSIFSKIDKISDSIKNLDIDKIPILIIFSGDIANTGNVTEYIAATEFINNLKKQLNDKGFTEIYVFIVPGNHDCNFSDEDYCTMRDLAKAEILKSPDNIQDVFIKSAIGVQNDFFDFSNSIISYKLEDIKAKLYYRHEFQINEKTISVDLINTSWISEKNEMQSNIVFPYKLIEDLNKKVDLSISVLHHPFNWIDANNAIKFRDKVESNSDIIFTGHEHKTKLSHHDNFSDYSNNYYFEGGVLKDKDNSLKSDFNLFIINLKEEIIRYINYSLEGDNYKMTLDDKRQFLRNQTFLKKQFKITDHFFEYLNNIGISLTHKGKEKIVLSDLFILPNFKILKDEDKFEFIEGKEILNKKNILLIGNLNSGKTTLAKYLFRYYYNNSSLPIFLNGEDIKHTSKDKIESFIIKKLYEQYNINSKEEFLSIEKEKRIVIIDDFQLTKLNFKAKNKVITKLQLYFDNIIVLSDSFVQLEVILSRSDEDILLSVFDHYRFQHFGNIQRKLLIEKWLSLGNEDSYEDPILTENVLRTIELVDKLLGKNMFPKYPCFILLIMQQIEWQIPIDTQSVPYIHYYESIITRAFDDSEYKLEIGTKYTFLSFIAFEMFKTESKKLTYDELEKTYNIYYKQIQRKFDYNKMIADFQKLNILDCYSNQYYFKYQYLYYYFVSIYITDEISKGHTEVNKIIERIIYSLQKEEFANIFLFITYLTKDKNIIDMLINKANSLINDIEPCDFEKHTNFINSLVNDIPKLIMKERTPRENIEELLETKDKIENQVENIKNDESDNRDDEIEEVDKESLELISRINESIKTVQILGQVIKNSPGSIDADVKVKVTEACFSLGMRSLNIFIKIVENNIDSFVLLVEDIIKREEGDKIDMTDKVQQDRINDLSKKITFYILEFISKVFVKNISRAIGSSKLIETFIEVLGSKKITSYKLINASIEIDYVEGFPEKNVTNLADELSKNYFALELLKLLVVEHFDFHDVNYKVKQSVCAKLNISYEKIKQIEQRTKNMR